MLTLHLIFLLYFPVDLLKELLLDSFISFLLLELLLFVDFVLYDLFQLSLILPLPQLPKMNQISDIVADFDFAFGTCQGLDPGKRIVHSFSSIRFVVGFSPCPEARLTCKMTFIFFTGIQLNVFGKILFSLVTDATLRGFTVPELFINP